MASSLPTLLGGLGRVIRRLREPTGYSQERFASRIGVHRTYMGHLERGTGNPTVRTLQLVAQGLGISVGELLTLAETEASATGTTVTRSGPTPARAGHRQGRTARGPLQRVAEPAHRKPGSPKRKT